MLGEDSFDHPDQRPPSPHPTGVCPGDLPFEKGDTVLVRPGVLPSRGYWLAKVGERRGIVPRYLLDSGWRVQVRFPNRVFNHIHPSVLEW